MKLPEVDGGLEARKVSLIRKQSLETCLKWPDLPQGI